MASVIDAHYSLVDNGRPGLYVTVRATQRECRNGATVRLARRTATRYGYRPDGDGRGCPPVARGADWYEHAFWFYERALGHAS